MSYAHKITSNKKVSLGKLDPDADGGLERQEGEERLKALLKELVELQELLYAAADTSVLIVLQGMDTSGKDGTIRLVMGPLNSQGCHVASFKVPTPEEMAHDFLWRVHAKTPARGQMTIFNRSHYEDVLVVRVLELVKRKAWKKRYDQINEFEELLAESGTIILKFFLHIDSAEQEKRLLEREENQTKAWKLSVGDWQNRQHWDAYSAAYEDAINKCAAKHAPWYVVPANRKWFRNLAIAEAIVETLRPYKQGWLDKLAAVGQAEKEKIEAFRREKP